MKLLRLPSLFLFIGILLLSFPVQGNEGASLDFLCPPHWSFQRDSSLFFLELAPWNDRDITSVCVFSGPEWKEEIAPEGNISEREVRGACFWMIALDVSDKGRRRKTIKQQRKDALLLISRLPETDRVTIYAVEKGKASVCVALPPQQAAEKLARAEFNGAPVSGGVTHLYKNLVEMARAVPSDDSLPEMKSMVVCSDGRDELGGISGIVFREELERQLRRLEMTFHGIGYMESEKDIPFTGEFSRLADGSGGSCILVDRRAQGGTPDEALDAVARFSRKIFTVPFRLSGVKGKVKVMVTGKSGKTWTGEYSADEFGNMSGASAGQPLKTEPGLVNVQMLIRRILVALDGAETGEALEERNSVDALSRELLFQLESLAVDSPDRFRGEMEINMEKLEDGSALEKGVSRLILRWVDLLKRREKVTVDSVKEDIREMADSVKNEEEEKAQAASVLPESSLEEGFMMPLEDEGEGNVWMVAGGGVLAAVLGWGGWMLVRRSRRYPVLMIHNRTMVRYPIKGAVTRIGKNPGNDCVISNESVSRVHCMIRREGAGRWSIADLQSANGVFVNNRKIVETELHDGDRIELGDVFMIFKTQR